MGAPSVIMRDARIALNFITFYLGFGVHLHLHVSCSDFIFRHNCLLSDSACLRMTYHNCIGRAARTDYSDIDSKTYPSAIS